MCTYPLTSAIICHTDIIMFMYGNIPFYSHLIAFKLQRKIKIRLKDLLSPIRELKVLWWV